VLRACPRMSPHIAPAMPPPLPLPCEPGSRPTHHRASTAMDLGRGCHPLLPLPTCPRRALRPRLHRHEKSNHRPLLRILPLIPPRCPSPLPCPLPSSISTLDALTISAYASDLNSSHDNRDTMPLPAHTCAFPTPRTQPHRSWACPPP
jgi:hypothetical protein